MKRLFNSFGLVTGAAGFLGVEHCKSILDANLSLIMIDTNKPKLNKEYKSLKNNYPYKSILKFSTDITSEKQVKNLYKFLSKKNIFVRTLINNACIDPKPQKINQKKSLIIKSWDKELNVGLKGSYHLIEYFTNQQGTISLTEERKERYLWGGLIYK